MMQDSRNTKFIFHVDIMKWQRLACNGTWKTIRHPLKESSLSDYWSVAPKGHGTRTEELLPSFSVKKLYCDLHHQVSLCFVEIFKYWYSRFFWKDSLYTLLNVLFNELDTAVPLLMAGLPNAQLRPHDSRVELHLPSYYSKNLSNLSFIQLSFVKISWF